MIGEPAQAGDVGRRRQGFDGFLKKPFHVRQVIEAVEDAMAIVY